MKNVTREIFGPMSFLRNVKQVIFSFNFARIDGKKYGDLATIEILKETDLRSIDPEARNEAGVTARNAADTRTTDEDGWRESFEELLEDIAAGGRPQGKSADGHVDTNLYTTYDMRPKIEAIVVELSDSETSEDAYEDALEKLDRQ